MAVAMAAVVASGIGVMAGALASRSGGDRGPVRGLVVGTGGGVNLENILLSSLDGPRARETGQEVLKNPPAGICRSV